MGLQNVGVYHFHVRLANWCSDNLRKLTKFIHLVREYGSTWLPEVMGFSVHYGNLSFI
jgi:hypothetical protein